MMKMDLKKTINSLKSSFINRQLTKVESKVLVKLCQLSLRDLTFKLLSRQPLSLLQLKLTRLRHCNR